LAFDPNEWWKISFLKKHFNKNKVLRCEKVFWVGHGSKAWNLCQKFTFLITYNIGFSPRNNARINLWKYSPLEGAPLESSNEYADFVKWMKRAGYKKLKDLSIWDLQGN